MNRSFMSHVYIKWSLSVHTKHFRLYCGHKKVVGNKRWDLVTSFTLLFTCCECLVRTCRLSLSGPSIFVFVLCFLLFYYVTACSSALFFLLFGENKKGIKVQSSSYYTPITHSSANPPARLFVRNMKQDGFRYLSSFYFGRSYSFCVSTNKTAVIQQTEAALMVIFDEFSFSLGIQEFPENIKNCKTLAIVEASVNPISKWVQLSLTEPAFSPD